MTPVAWRSRTATPRRAFLRAEIDRVLVHVQVDVPVHDLLAHLLGMLADERQAGVAMGERVLHASAQHAIHPLLHVVRQRAVDDDAAERNRRAGLALPELAEIDDLLQSLRLVGEPVLVNDQPGVELAVRAAPARWPKTAVRSCSRASGNARPSRKLAVVYFPGIAIRRCPPPLRLSRSRASKSAAVRSSGRARCRRRAARSRPAQ